MTTTRASTKLSRAVETTGLFGDGDRVLVAVSGGADSMALLHLLHELHPEGLCAAHFDHGIRPDGGRDRALVESFCARRGIPCDCGVGDVLARARVQKESLEEAARKLRYEFLEAAADRAGATRIATAHTLDDHIETVLMRLLRGSGIRGIAGIPARRGRIIRPLLSARRLDTVTYCHENSVPFREDPTNADTRFARNRIRHVVLPTLRRADPGVEDDLVAVGRVAAERLRAIRAVTDDLVARHLVREGPDVWRLPAESVAGLGDDELYVLFADLLARELGCDADATRYHYEMLARLVRGRLRTGARVSLPRVAVRREHDGLVFRRAGDRRALALDGGYQELAAAGATRLPGLVIACEEVERGEVDFRGGDVGAYVAYFDRDAIEPPLRARRYEHGDRMRPFGMRGHKKLSDIFIDRKIPHRHRQDAFVVEDRREIVWLVGVTTSESTRVTNKSTSIVRLTAVVDRGSPE